MRVLVCGGRDYANVDAVDKMLSNFLSISDGALEIIHGAAPGADSLAAKWAQSNKVTVRAYPADWDAYGKAAGPIRNRMMLEQERPNVVIAFPGGRGTLDMKLQAAKAGVKVIEVLV